MPERADYGSLQAAVSLDKERGLALLAGRLLLALLELAVPVKVQVLQELRSEGRNIRAYQREEPDDLHQARHHASHSKAETAFHFLSWHAAVLRLAEMPTELQSSARLILATAVSIPPPVQAGLRATGRRAHGPGRALAGDSSAGAESGACPRADRAGPAAAGGAGGAAGGAIAADDPAENPAQRR